MRFMVLVLLAPTLAAQVGDAEKLFRTMEKKVAAAKTVRVAFEAQVLEDKEEQARFTGSVQLGEANKGAVRLKGRAKGMDIEVELESDGHKIKEVVTPPGKSRERSLPKKFGERVRAALSRTGPVSGLVVTERQTGPDGVEKDPDIDQMLPLSDFKPGGKETVGGREARVIEYKARLASEKQDLSVKLWLDVKTQLPLKREVSGERRGRPFRVVETYSEFDLK
jgi:hypothetical protein